MLMSMFDRLTTKHSKSFPIVYIFNGHLNANYDVICVLFHITN